jgi:hypothetical protein
LTTIFNEDGFFSTLSINESSSADCCDEIH